MQIALVFEIYKIVFCLSDKAFLIIKCFMSRRLLPFNCLGWALFFHLMISATTVFGSGSPSDENRPADTDDILVTLTNISQVRHLADHQQDASCSVRLQGVVLWVNPALDGLILEDDSGGMAVKIDLHNQLSVQPGQQVLIEGDCMVGRDGILSKELIDNDGIHSSLERSNTVFLSAGLHPISAEWFNGPADFELDLDYMGPDLPRRRIPDSVLYRTELDPASGTNHLVQGLDYRDYEGTWERLPDFSQLPILKRGAITNFSLQVRTRDTNVGLVFSGYFKALQDGKYTFWLKSDDGSKLYIGDHPLQLTQLGKAAFPSPRMILPSQFASEELECQWAEIEGQITRISEVYSGISAEISSGTGRAYLKVPSGNYDSLYDSLRKLLHSRVRVMGIYQNAANIDGQMMPSLLVTDPTNIAITEVDPMSWSNYSSVPIDILAGTNFSDGVGAIVRTGGIVGTNASGQGLVIEDGVRKIFVETDQAPPEPGDRVEVLGWWNREGERTFLANGFFRKLSSKTNDLLEGMPLLTKAIQIKSLSRKEARRGYPVKIQGVITARVGIDFVIQDSTWSVFSYWHVPAGATDRVPQIGDYWEIEGKSSVDFAPEILVENATYLRPGILPEPIQPTQDELINGSLDTQYIEMQGIATEMDANAVTLLTRQGSIRIQFYGTTPRLPGKIEDALIRVRGVGSPDRDVNQMIAQPTLLRLFNTVVSVDEPAPEHPFEIPLKRASDLLFFDARADTLRRVKIAGQVLLERNGEYFLMDGDNGFRFEPKKPVGLQTGDLVEVVGFPDVSGPSPVLREALVRVVGKASLPKPQQLSEHTVISGKLDATLVQIESRLVSLNMDRSEQILELQAGTRGYVARLANKSGRLTDMLPGSQLELTGVYAGQGGDRASSRNIDSFELLINSPADVRILARPSWWTFRHTLTVLGGMFFVMIAGLVWITLLRRQVEERSLQLAMEVKSREKAEHQRALEMERARIAQDLHDDLGATLTEIRFLGAVKSRDSLVPETTRLQLREISEKSRQMVSSLDEIVWAVNPANDSVPSLAVYLRHVAEEFFRTTEVRCRLDVDQSLPAVALTSEVRHNLYLIVREALNNIAKHAQATEAWLRIHWKDRALHINIEDNGCGFNVATAASQRNGLSNMRHRLEKIGGHFECDSRPGSGTICRIVLAFTP
jgi:signal transduction histidine kinase